MYRNFLNKIKIREKKKRIKKVHKLVDQILINIRKLLEITNEKEIQEIRDTIYEAF